MKRFIFYLFCMILIFSHTRSPAENILIGTDSNYWYPYTFVENNKPAGIHIDIVKKALKNTGHTAIFNALPWKRCLSGLKTGDLNAVVSASYKEERAKYMLYPADTVDGLQSKWRITQVSYIVTTRKDSNYTFDGDLSSLPKPVLAPLGYSIVDDLQAAGVEVQTEYTIYDCIRTMNKLKVGSTIMPPRNAEMINRTLPKENQLKIHSQPIKSKSYYMVFSKKNPKLSIEEIHAIWNEIEKIRNDETYMIELSNHYQ